MIATNRVCALTWAGNVHRLSYLAVLGLKLKITLGVGYCCGQAKDVDVGPEEIKAVLLLTAGCDLHSLQ